jgi:hypothetical protein
MQAWPVWNGDLAGFDYPEPENFAPKGKITSNQL